MTTVGARDKRGIVRDDDLSGLAMRRFRTGRTVLDQFSLPVRPSARGASPSGDRPSARSRAQTATWAREVKWSFSRMWRTCDAAVLSLMKRVPAISALD